MEVQIILSKCSCYIRRECNSKVENILLDLDETIAAIYHRSRNDRSIFVMFLVLKSPRVKEKRSSSFELFVVGLLLPRHPLVLAARGR